jgi:type VI secretion system protein ImpB
MKIFPREADTTSKRVPQKATTMAKEGVHEKLQRVRRPRVHIKFDVELEDGVPMNEIPFIVGVMGDFSGNNPGEKLKPLRDRKFINIDRDNFNDVMKRMTPGLNLRAKNTLAGDDSEMAVQLKFESIEDFEPANVVNQVEPLKKLLDARNKLKEILTKCDLSPDLEAMLEEVLKNPANVQKIAGEVGAEAPNNDGGQQ